MSSLFYFLIRLMEAEILLFREENTKENNKDNINLSVILFWKI